MKKIFILLLIGVLVVPNVSLAAWWNPFSWRKYSEESAVTTKAVTSGSYRFYVTSKANIRACQGLGCVVVTQVNQGNYFDFPGESGYVSQTSLPEWVSVAWKDGAVTKYGFINKALLSEKYVPEVAVKPKAQVSVSTPAVQQEIVTPIQPSSVTENYQTCGGKYWNQCPAGTNFYCAADGVGHCSAPVIQTQTNNTSVTSQLLQIMQDSQRQQQEYQQKIASEDATTTKMRLIDSLKQNDSFKAGWETDQTCGAAYKARNTDIERSLKILLKYCMRSSTSLTPSAPTTPTREVCKGSQYDPVTGTLRLFECKEW